MKELPNEENLREVLGSLPGVKVHSIRPGWGGLRAIVTADRWRGVDEGERQREVWDLLLKEFGISEQLKNIGFIFTDTPEYRAAIDVDVCRDNVKKAEAMAAAATRAAAEAVKAAAAAKAVAESITAAAASVKAAAKAEAEALAAADTAEIAKMRAEEAAAKRLSASHARGGAGKANGLNQSRAAAKAATAAG